MSHWQREEEWWYILIVQLKGSRNTMSINLWSCLWEMFYIWLNEKERSSLRGCSIPWVGIRRKRKGNLSSCLHHSASWMWVQCDQFLPSYTTKPSLQLKTVPSGTLRQLIPLLLPLIIIAGKYNCLPLLLIFLSLSIDSFY